MSTCGVKVQNWQQYVKIWQWLRWHNILAIHYCSLRVRQAWSLGLETKKQRYQCRTTTWIMKEYHVYTVTSNRAWSRVPSNLSSELKWRKLASQVYGIHPAEILFVLNGTVMTTKLTMEPRVYYGLKGTVGAW